MRSPTSTRRRWLLAAAVGVLTRWRTAWPARPDAVVAMPSRRRPRLIDGVAAHLADVGRLELVPALSAVGDAPAPGLSPAVRARHVEASLVTTAAAGALAGRTVLLLDDVWRTGWTATVAGALLRDAGAAAVLPLVLHQRP